MSQSKQGKRSDIEAVRDAVAAGASKRSLYEEFPDVAAKFPRYIETMIRYRVEDSTDKLLEFVPNSLFQHTMLEWVKTAPDPRKILWIYDPIGNTGKSYISKHLVDAHGAFYTNGGKGTDITYAYQGEPIVIFDYVRDSKDYVNYGVIEQIKNGMLFSSKYESGMKRFNIPHVIVFANFLPDRYKFSRDRYEVNDISNPDDLLEMRWEDLPGVAPRG